MQGLYSHRNVHSLKFKASKKIGYIAFFFVIFLSFPLIIGINDVHKTLCSGEELDFKLCRSFNYEK